MVKDLIIFSAGAALGGAVTWLMVKKHYEDISNQETSEIREYYRSKENPKEETDISEEEVEPEEKLNPGVANYMEMAKQYSSTEDTKEKKAYEISEEEFIKSNGFDKETYIYFDKDNILIDAYNERQDGVLDDIGENLLNGFEGQILYARNDELNMDYEVIFEARTYENYMNDDTTEEGEEYQEE